MLLMARVASFFRVVPLSFTGDYKDARLITKEERTLQRRVVSQVRRLSKRNKSDIGRSKLCDGRNLSWLYLPTVIKFRQPNGRRGLSLRVRSAMIAVVEPSFSLQVGQMGYVVKSYLVSPRGGGGLLTVHMVVHNFDYRLGVWAPMPKRRLDPTTEFIEQDDLFKPDAEELTELYYAVVAAD